MYHEICVPHKFTNICELVFDVVVAADVGAGASGSSFPVVSPGMLLYVFICVVTVIGLRVFCLLMGTILVAFFTAMVVDTDVHDSSRSPGPTPPTDCPSVSSGSGLQPQTSIVRPAAVVRP